ncbi:hypothetical protein ABPG74_006736 [Tetrahymena malaccensis]
MFTLVLFLTLFRYSISQELIVSNLSNQYATTGQGFHKDWSNSDWNNNLDFAIYGWFKISSQQTIADWIVGFHFTSNDNAAWSNASKLGDRVLSFFILGNQIQTPTYTTNQPNLFNILSYTANDLDKWAFIYVACTQSGNSLYSYFQFASSGVVKQQVPNVIHYTSNFYQIYVGYTKFYAHYFAGQICSLYLSAGPNAYTENEAKIKQLFNIQPSIALSCSFCYGTLQFTTSYQMYKQLIILSIQDVVSPFYRYMNLQLQFQFIVQTCNQSGASTAFEPLDIQFTSSAVPSLSQTYSQFSKSIMQINLKKYQIPFNSNLDIQRLDKKQSMLSIVPEQIIQPTNNNINNSNNNLQAIHSPNQTKIKEENNQNKQEFDLQKQQDKMEKQNITNKNNFQLRLESHFSQSLYMTPSLNQQNLQNQQQQQNKNLFDQNPGNDIEIVELDQLEQKQENPYKQNESSKLKQPNQIFKQKEEIQQLDSLNNQISEDNLQNTDKQQTNLLFALANTNSNINTNIMMFTSNLIPQQQNQYLNQIQINNTSMKEPSIVKLEQQQTSLVKNLDNFNHQDQQKEGLQIERFDQQYNCGVSIRQDQSENKKNSNNQQQSLGQSKLAQEDQKSKEQYIIDKNLKKLYKKPFVIKIILFHDFFNIFYTYDNKMSRGIRFNIFYLRIIHSLCLTTIFDDSYSIYQKVLISIFSSLILVTGVKIITLIHKIKTIGQKLSLIILLSLLIFYYYVILSIISGEEASYANSKTVSFILILGIDFLGILTLISILKLSLIYLSEKYQKKDSGIMSKLYNFLDLKFLLQSLAF